MQAALILMSSAPVAGETTIKLESHFKDDESVELHKAFLKDLSTKFLNFKKSCSRLDLYLSYTPEESVNLFADLVGEDFERLPQSGNDQGERMYNAAVYAYQKSNLPVIITDFKFPLLDLDIFTEALAGLKERDLVIGPSLKGDYYLLGMQKPADFLFEPDICRNCSILEKTIRSASQHNLKTHFLPETFGLNTFKDLLQLRAEISKKEKGLNYPLNTKEAIDKLLAPGS